MPVELAELMNRVTREITTHVSLPDFHPGEVSCWIRFVKPGAGPDGTEATIGSVQKLMFEAGSFMELARAVAENVLLAVYGAEVPVVAELPNLILKLFEAKVTVSMPGAPPLDQADQIFAKVTVYRYDPSLWERLFPRKAQGE